MAAVLTIDRCEMGERPPTVHHVGFREDRDWNAYRLLGGPRMIHRRWERYAVGEVGPGDVVVFAEGDETQPVARWPGADIDERLLSAPPDSLPRHVRIRTKREQVEASMLQVGDAVRVVPGSSSAGLLDAWSDLTGSVDGVSTDGALVWVRYPGPVPGYGMALPAADFQLDVPLDAAPF